MTMAIAIIFDILILAYFGSKVEIVDIIRDCFNNPETSGSNANAASGRADANPVKKKRWGSAA